MVLQLHILGSPPLPSSPPQSNPRNLRNDRLRRTLANICFFGFFVFLKRETQESQHIARKKCQRRRKKTISKHTKTIFALFKVPNRLHLPFSTSPLVWQVKQTNKKKIIRPLFAPQKDVRWVIKEKSPSWCLSKRLCKLIKKKKRGKKKKK